MDVHRDIKIPAHKATVLRGHTSEVFSCAWSTVADFLASGSGDSTARIWDMSDSSTSLSYLVLEHNVLKQEDITSLSWSYDGQFLATGLYQGSSKIWSVNGSLKSTICGHTGFMYAMKWNKLGSHLLTAGADNKAVVWDSSSGLCTQQFSFHTAPVNDIDWQNNTTFASCSKDKNIHICRLNVFSPIKTFKGHTDEVNILTWDPQGIILASGSDDTTTKIWSMKQDRCVQDLKVHTNRIYNIKWSPTGPGTSNPNMNLVLACASVDMIVTTWDVERGICLLKLIKHTEPVNSIAFSPNGRLLASVSFDKYLYIWCTQTGGLVYSYKSLAGIFDVSWNSRSTKVAASTNDGSLFVLDLRKI